MKNKIVFFVIFLAATIFMLNFLFKKSSISNRLKPPSDLPKYQAVPTKKYFDDLQKSCSQVPANDRQCCLSSVETMRKSNYLLALEECIDGTERMSLRCLGSMSWCQPK